MRRLILRENTYIDSVNLMMLSDRLIKKKNVSDVAILTGTPANKKRLREAGFYSDKFESAKPNDLCIGLEVDNESGLEEAKQEIEVFLSGQFKAREKQGESRQEFRSLQTALLNVPDANLVSISVPGEYASSEAHEALDNNLHVFLFSDNVTIEEEINLKRDASEKGLLMMGPDCGTALINGNPFGFCNDLNSGPVGLVAASGTGAQAISTQLNNLGIGVSHIIGTGGRDLNSEVGGITSKVGLQVLRNDPSTEIIIFVSKPPSPEVEDVLINEIEHFSKPVIISFVGSSKKYEGFNNIYGSENLSHAALIATSLMKDDKKELPAPHSYKEVLSSTQRELLKIRKSLNPVQKHIRGLYSGGTLADEAAYILSKHFTEVHAGTGFDLVAPINDWQESYGHTIIDLGDDRFTKNRPHPMIDSEIRANRIIKESQDESVAVILMDIVLGYNAAEDPAGALLGAIKEGRARAAKEGRSLNFIVHLCGTRKDPQGWNDQRKKLQDAGCLLFTSNVEAALAAAIIVKDEIG